jgi:transposase
MAHPNDPDLKSEELRKRGALHPRPEQVTDELFTASEFFDPRDAIQVKYEMLRRARIDGQPIARVVRDHGYSRPTFYEAQAAFERDGLYGLLPRKRGPRRAHKLSTVVMEFVHELMGEDPTLVAADLVERIRQRFKLSVHPRSVERALKREKGGS